MSNRSVKTTKIGGGAEYALVPARLMQFREDNPRASIDSNSTIEADGSVTFKTVIIKDQADPYSAKGSGNARYTEAEMQKPKAYEKLQTISIGRALANIGYLNNGEIASSEEMEEFNAYKEQQHAEAVQQAIERLTSARTIEDLKSVFVSLGGLIADEEVIAAKDKRKAELSKEVSHASA